MNLLELPEVLSHSLLSLDGPRFHNNLPSPKLLRKIVTASEIKFSPQILLHPI